MTFHPESVEQEQAPMVVSRVRSALVHGGLALFALAIIGRAAQLQLVEGEQWAQVASAQQIRRDTVEPPRGALVDANGNVLVETRELIRINITPRNVRRSKKHDDPKGTLRRQLGRLGVPAVTVRRALDSTVKWVPIKGEFLPSQVEPLVGVPGVSFERVLRRQNSASEGMRRIVGAVDNDGVARGGLEEELDEWLRGKVGTSALVRDPRGIPMETPLLSGTAARPGHTVVLTLNQSLQEIAERELRKGMLRTNASGGDIVIVDARDGAVLAMAGARDGRPAAATTALTEAYEPGSVIKPFLVAHLLDQGRTREDEIIDTENGSWRLEGRRNPITDEHKARTMSVYDVIRYSSNIGAVKLALRMKPAEEYQVLRDFGFGVPTGVSFTSESRGSLRPPENWSKPTASAYAMGYELAATPLQIAMAYGAVASGGELLQPSLVREIRDADGQLLYRHERRALRRVLTSEGARRIQTILASVVDSGTGTAARLATFDVAGKSGTARRAENGRYAPNGYNASFAGMFPAQQPQLVFVARLIDPKGVYYGGLVAAPMVNSVLQAAIATRDGSLDRVALAEVARPLPRGSDSTDKGHPDGARRRAVMIASADTVEAPVAKAAPIEPIVAPGRIVVSLVGSDSSVASERKPQRKAPVELREVPLVAGLNVREAVRTLRTAGFDVKLVRGKSGRTLPAAGSQARAGSVVALEMMP